MAAMTFPRRDPLGRVATLADLLVAVVAGIVLGLVILAAVDGVAALFGGQFGTASGFFAGILPVWLFLEDYRAWAGVPLRAVLAAATGLANLMVALAVSNAAGTLAHLVSGALGVTVGCGGYALVWYFGIRWLEHRGAGQRRNGQGGR